MATKTSGSGGGTLLILLAIAGLFLYQNQHQTVTPNVQADENHARAYVAGDFAFAGVQPDSPNPPTPEPAPNPGKCIVCNGTGKVGDGRVFVDCGTCGGDGFVSSKAEWEKMYHDLDSMSTEELYKMGDRAKADWQREQAGCQCGPECKCKDNPNNPDCKCDNCKCDPVKAEKPPSPPEQEIVVGRRQVVLYRDPSQRLPVSTIAIEALKTAGWSVGNDGLINVQPDSAQYPHGTWALLEGGRVLKTCWLDLNAQQVADFYNDGTVPKPLTQTGGRVWTGGGQSGRWVRSCGPNGCTMQWVPE